MNRRASIFSLLYLGAIVYLSLYPFEFLGSARSFMLYWVESPARRVFWDTALNVLFYVPLGAAVVAAFGRSGPAWFASVACATLLSLAIEVAQLFTPARYGNLRDLTANSMGAVIGASAAYLLPQSRFARRISPMLRAVFDSEAWKLPRAALLFLILWMVWQAFPFVPVESLAKLSQAWERFDWSWLEAGRSLFGFYALALAAGPGWGWLAVVLLVLPAQPVLIDHSLSPGAIAGALAGWVMASRIPTPRFAAGCLVGWLVVEAVARQPGSAVSVYSSHALLYASAVWALRRARAGWAVSVLVPTVIAAVGPAAVTDLALLAAGAALVRRLERSV